MWRVFPAFETARTVSGMPLTWQSPWAAPGVELRLMLEPLDRLPTNTPGGSRMFPLHSNALLYAWRDDRLEWTTERHDGCRSSAKPIWRNVMARVNTGDE